MNMCGSHFITCEFVDGGFKLNKGLFVIFSSNCHGALYCHVSLGMMPNRCGARFLEGQIDSVGLGKCWCVHMIVLHGGGC